MHKLLRMLLLLLLLSFSTVHKLQQRAHGGSTWAFLLLVVVILVVVPVVWRVLSVAGHLFLVVHSYGRPLYYLQHQPWLFGVRSPVAPKSSREKGRISSLVPRFWKIMSRISASIFTSTRYCANVRSPTALRVSFCICSINHALNSLLYRNFPPLLILIPFLLVLLLLFILWPRHGHGDVHCSWYRSD